MAKQNSTKNGSNSLSRHSRLRLWSGKNPRKTVFLALLVALIAWLGASLIAQHIQRNHEKAQFIQAKVDLDDIYTQIVKQVGQPTAHKATQTCSYTSEEFSKGALSCDVDNYLYYDVTSSAKGIILAERIQTVISANSRVINEKTITLIPGQGSVLSASFNLKSIKTCSVDSRYASSKDSVSLPGFILRDKPGLSLDLNCSKSALAEYFPVVKN